MSERRQKPPPTNRGQPPKLPGQLTATKKMRTSHRRAAGVRSMHRYRVVSFDRSDQPRDRVLLLELRARWPQELHHLGRLLCFPVHLVPPSSPALPPHPLPSSASPWGLRPGRVAHQLHHLEGGIVGDIRRSPTLRPSLMSCMRGGGAKGCNGHEGGSAVEGPWTSGRPMRVWVEKITIF